MRDFHHHELELRYLPSGVKGRVARVMAKRGLMNERNMELVSKSVRDGPGVGVKTVRLEVASFPAPREGAEKGLVSTVCECT